jgi:hypothetical protein
LQYEAIEASGEELSPFGWEGWTAVQHPHYGRGTAKMAGRAAELPKWQISKYRAKKVWHTVCYEYPNIILT